MNTSRLSGWAALTYNAPKVGSKHMATKEALARRIDKVMEFASSGNAEEAHRHARLLLKELDEYIDEKIMRALQSAEIKE